MAAATQRSSGRHAGYVGRLGRVLGVWAHPDDETYLSAGLMAAAVEAGQYVGCLTATDGEHGTADPHRWPPALLAAERRREVRAALDVVGVSDHVRLGYEDGTLSEVDPDVGVERLLATFRELEPDTIVTFGPDGITGHTDHRTVGAWAASAAVLYGCADVIFAAKTHEWLADFGAPCDRAGMFETGFPHAVPDDELLIDLVLDDGELDRKVAALECHATQVGPAIEVLGRDCWRELVRRECFRSGWSCFARSYAALSGAP